MSTSSEGIAASLAEVAASGDAAEANTAEGVMENLQDVVAAAEGRTEQSTEESGSKGRGAQERIQELVSQTKEISSNYEALQAQYEDSQRSISNLTDLLTSSREDSDIVTGIRNLAGDPKHRHMIEQLEAALKGESIEEEPVEGETPEQAATRQAANTAKLLEERIQQTQQEAANIRSDQLVSRADQIADQWIAGLPEEYTNVDRNQVSHLWAGLVDWELLQGSADPMAELEPYLRETFQEALNILDTPRGKLLAEAGELQTQELEPVKSPEEELSELLETRQYGAMKEGAEGFDPQFSNDDFTRDLAAAMKVANSKG